MSDGFYLTCTRRTPTDNFRLEYQKGMEFLHFWRLSEDLLGHIELPCKSIRIPASV